MRLLAHLIATGAIAAALAAVWLLERERAGLTVTDLTVEGTPVTLWRPKGNAAVPLVVVVHGYAGSRQMMRAVAVTLARSGAAAAVIDLPGHGRHPDPMTGDVTRLDGATMRLTETVIAVARALEAKDDIGPGLALLGHSMATDVVIRAAGPLSPDAVVAVSMYSEAVSPTAPDRLLILSGEWEGRLRMAAIDALRQVDPRAMEGDTAARGEVARRAVAVPLVGHVGVLYAPAAMREARDWIAGAVGIPPRGRPSATAAWLVLLLGSTVALAYPVAAIFGQPREYAPQHLGRVAWAALLLPIGPSIAATVAMPHLGDGLAFVPLAAFLATWAGLQLAVLSYAGRVPRSPLRPCLAATIAFALWAGLFAFALDRYGASFVPLGPRLVPFMLLIPATLLYAYADAWLAGGTNWAVRWIARALPLAALLAAMLMDPPLGVAFTVLPVFILFWLVFGTAAHWMAARAGVGATTPVLGVMLAWAIAASTPVIAG